MAHYQPGHYECIIRAQGFEVSPKKKTPCLWLRCTPVLADGDGDFDCVVRLWITDKTVEHVIARLRALGWTGDSFKDLEPGGYQLKGKTVRLRCKHEQDGDKVWDRWEFPHPDSGPVAENTAGVAKKLDALFAKSLKGGAKPVKAAAEAPSQAPDNDIPF